MSRSGYYNDGDDMWALKRWRGQVASAIRGKRGQRFLWDLIAALDAMPVKRLIRNDLQVQSGDVCALGALALAKGIDPFALDTENYPQLAATFDIAEQLAQETMWMNDECGAWDEEPEKRWELVRRWAAQNINPVAEDTP